MTRTSRLAAITMMGVALLPAGCAQHAHMTLLIHMIKDQENYFRSELVPEFNRESKARVDVATFGSTDSIEFAMDKYGKKLGLVKVPFDKSAVLVREKRVRALDDVLTPEQMQEFTQTNLLTSLGKFNGKYYYIPRKFETRIMVYCKSKVGDAVRVWRTHKDSVNAAMKKMNGYGLPAAYSLEDDPNMWDYFDVFTVGWIWAHTPYGGKTAPRIAFRGRRYSGTSLGLIDRVFECGGDSNAVLTMRGDAVVDAIQWEAVLAAGGALNERMWKESWAGQEIWQGFKSGDVFLSFMTQLDCFFIHGTGRDGLDGYLDKPDDMGVAVMPAGCSLELDKNGDPLRAGGRSTTTGGWWWGIPAGAPDPALSYRLARFITSTENQIQECSRFGMIPVRKDILSDMSMMFGGEWITSIYEVSFKQLMLNKNTAIPSNPHFAEISNLYLDALYDIVVNRTWSTEGEMPDRKYISLMIANRYSRKAAALLGGATGE